MPRSKKLNIELRSFILQHTIRQEYLTSQILVAIFRILKCETKAFGNSGSTLSFQTKIDLLYDLNEITNTDYPHFKKLLEIRNQFAHNPNCNSFLALKRDKVEYTKYLNKNFPNTENESENSILCSYVDLFKHCHRILLKIKTSYLEKINLEIEKYQSYELLQNRFSDWLLAAQEDLDQKLRTERIELTPDATISFFIMSLTAYKYKFFAEILEPDLNSSRLLRKIFNK